VKLKNQKNMKTTMKKMESSKADKMKDKKMKEGSKKDMAMDKKAARTLVKMGYKKGRA
jgi:hypothetical protein